MNRRWWAMLAALCAAGFALRAAVGVFDARRPLFPTHYYNDERDYLDSASLILDGRLDARRTALTPGKEGYTRWLALLARGFGPGPLPGRLANAAAGGLTIGLWGWSTAVVTTPPAGLAAAAFIAAWPSHNFHTSMAIKESPISLLLALCVTSLLAGLAADGGRRRLWFAAAAAAALGLSLMRAYLLPILALSAVAAVVVRPGRSARRVPFVALLWIAVAFAASFPLRWAFQEPTPALPTPPPVAVPASESAFGKPLFGLGARRRTLVEGSRIWSVQQYGRAPESLLFPDQALNTWLDLALFLPKACFHELFMPLPGLYPTEGKPGRVLASMEGLVLLAVFAAAAWGLRKSAWGPQSVFLASFFILAVPPTAFFEYDLGSASRHRIHYFPFLLPFAGAALPFGRSKP